MIGVDKVFVVIYKFFVNDKRQIPPNSLSLQNVRLVPSAANGAGSGDGFYLPLRRDRGGSASLEAATSTSYAGADVVLFAF